MLLAAEGLTKRFGGVSAKRGSLLAGPGGALSV
jgi:hypothetical protein